MSQAIFILPGGEVEIVGIGESISGAKVSEVTADSVTLDHHGRLVKLTVKKESSDR